MTAQELPIGSPNEPGILWGLAQRCGRALSRLQDRGVLGVASALAQVQTIVRTVKAHQLFAKDQGEKRWLLNGLLREVGQLVQHAVLSHALVKAATGSPARPWRRSPPWPRWLGC